MIGALMTPLLLSLTGLAQDVTVPAINAQLFRPSIDSTNLLWTDDASRGQSGYTSGRVLLSYANDPLVYTLDSGERIEVLSDILQMDLMGGYTWGRVRLGADLPILLYSAGSTGSESSLGDVGADARVSILDRSTAPIGLALSGRLAFPTATGTLPVGSDGLGWEVSAIVDRTIGRALLAANLGTRGIPETTLDNVQWDDQLFFRTGAGYSITDRTGASLELTGNFTYGELTNSAGTPVEGLLGGWLRPGGGNMLLRAGVGSGLNIGIGAPRLRTVLALSYEPPMGEDTDGDGLLDAFDECPERPEDADGHDDRDGCPDPTLVTIQFVDGDGAAVEGVSYTLDGSPGSLETSPMWTGTYSIAATAYGYQALKSQLSVPGGERHEATVTLKALKPGRLVVRVSDSTGGVVDGAVWLIDGVEQGEIGKAARSSLLPGTYRISAFADGHLRSSKTAQIRADLSTTVEITLRPTTTTVTRDRIDLGGKIYFETAKDVIKEESHALLEDVAAIMMEFPEIRQVRIEGHTDNRGNAGYNQQLSDDRSASVTRFLIDRGVDPERLNSIGYGESKPVDGRNSERAWAMNRRVDFFIEEWVDIERTVPLSPGRPMERLEAPVEEAPVEGAEAPVETETPEHP
ncbi:MAG: outer membrane protein OmpA-like peptidoglycan-associated protein [Myxococcota bacterium]|jgi:outer membrane protein OmpA-like peptidoglycan-associated protein